jgi:hypothetical protein
MRHRATAVILGHAVGMLAALGASAFAPQVMDGAMCVLALVRASDVEAGCFRRSAGLGEGGVNITWSVVAYLLGLVLIMEAALWLRRLYRVPGWVGPIVVLAGSLTIMSALVFQDIGAESPLVAAIFSVPVTFAFSAYWVPLLLLRTPRQREGATS